MLLLISNHEKFHEEFLKSFDFSEVFIFEEKMRKKRLKSKAEK
jgi:hypothetical protein